MDEETLSCMMRKITANDHWLPKLAQIRQQNLVSCINFANIEGPLPFGLSTVTQYFTKIEYQMSEQALQEL